MDAIVKGVFKTYIELDNYVERDFRSILFESDDAVEKENEGAIKRAASALKNAIDKLIKLFKDLIYSVNDLISKAINSQKEREAKKQLEQLLREHPELKKEKIDMIDMKSYIEVYDQCIKTLEKEAQKEDPSDTTADQVINRLDSSVKEMSSNTKNPLVKLAQKGLAIVTIETAMTIADADDETAKVMNKALEYEIDELDSLRDMVGDEKIDNAKATIKKSANKTWLSRMKAKIFKRKTSAISQIVANRYTSMLAEVRKKIKKTNPIVNDLKRIKKEAENSSAPKSSQSTADKLKDISRSMD